MSKVVAFVGSPRKKGYTTRLLESAVKGAEEAGAEVVKYDLNQPGIRGCQSCYYCRTHEGCAQRDPLTPMYDDIKDADAVIATFPMYFGSPNGQVKTWLDRMFPVVGPDHASRWPGKKALTIFSQGNPDPQFLADVIDKTNTFFKVFGWELVDSLLAYGTQSPDYELPQELLDKAFEDGKALVS